MKWLKGLSHKFWQWIGKKLIQHGMAAPLTISAPTTSYTLGVDHAYDEEPEVVKGYEKP